MCYCIPSVADAHEIVETLVVPMAPFFGAGGPMQLCLRRSCRSGLHRSSGLQKTQAIRMTNGFICHSGRLAARLTLRPCCLVCTKSDSFI